MSPTSFSDLTRPRRKSRIDIGLKLAALVIIGALTSSCQTNPYVQGERLYAYHCSSCHMSEGEGLAQLYPPLADSDYIERQPEKLPCIIRFGMSDTILVNGVEFDQPMEGNKALSNAEIANICNYIIHRWLDQSIILSESQVANILGQCTN